MGTNVNAVLNLDDNLSNGHAYTLVFQCTNTLFNPDAAKLADDIVANAPDFIGMLNVVRESGTGNANFYNVAFTYGGDGSDVVSDVVNALIAAFHTGSNDGFVYLVGFGANVPDYSAVSGGNSSGVSYAFSPLNLIIPVTAGQQAKYGLEARQQVMAVGTSPGGQLATAVDPTFASTVTAQANAAAANVDQIAGDANTKSAWGTGLILAAVAVVVGFALLQGPRLRKALA